MNKEIEFITSLIGKPWKLGAYGPNQYDCWSLSRLVQKELFGRDMPMFEDPPTALRGLVKLITTSEHRSKWQKVEEPKHGCLVEMTRSTQPYHLGVWLDIDGGAILHCEANYGVSWDKQVILLNSGWRRFTYYDWAG